jgi:hypothetical protein
VLIFRDVCEMGEIAESADDLGGSGKRQFVQDPLKEKARAAIFVAVEADGCLADVLDRLKHLLAFLAADRIAEEPPEEPDVVAKRQVLVGQLRCRHRSSSRRFTAPAVAVQHRS